MLTLKVDKTAVSPQRLHQVEVSKLMKLHKCLQNLNVEVISKNNEKKCLIISSYFLISSKLHLQRYTLAYFYLKSFKRDCFSFASFLFSTTGFTPNTKCAQEQLCKTMFGFWI